MTRYINHPKVQSVINHPGVKKVVNKKTVFWFAVAKLIVYIITAGFFITQANRVEAARYVDPEIKQVMLNNGDKTVYYLDHKTGLKKAYNNEQAFLSYKNNWSNIRKITSSGLKQWPEAKLIKTKYNPAVYYIEGQFKTPILNEADFKNFGFSKDEILTVTLADLDSYQLATYALIAPTSKTQNYGQANNTVARNTVTATKPTVSAYDWPVNYRTINYSFHDPRYPFRSVGEHTGIDINSPQGSDVMAIADGVVTQAVWSNTTAYSYIVISHANGLESHYGHLSEVKVAVGQQVQKGKSIARSGGAPGTTGAGQYTTGAHLHFETILKGNYVDPMTYLNN